MFGVFSVVFWAFLVVTCPVFFVGAVLVWLVTLPFDRRRVALHLYSCAWASFYVYICPLWRLSVRHRDRLPWRGPAVLVANHASLIDILVLFALFRPFKYVSKQEIFRVPVIGWNMRLNGYVPLVRGSGASVRRMMELCDAHLRAGSPLMIFPEGTRTSDGALQRFKNGAFDLAVRHDVPVFPIAVHGTRQALPRAGFVLREHIRARVEVLPPLLPGDFADAAALRDAARAAIAAELGQ
ncbi:1-acyl-sn-glycerol-3-phosphate acyltransferase [Actinoplanes philippinensis]|uniref:1-acyl-sn-glycerol-3-phosphate acyltransferase n=1 Tax=Actinoplanes philippinensis TaxID=35752 RepID=A0A1I2E0T3_9ACTN|nr:lysophospholipid acyltransferase family protein [Actinoplanes philippinensis]GIE77347.1 1-acyl-sn-glycerol-3-phosphate acyltransferase [Actinoplanes philippinensis]SFE86299.1 1-acyl-sn-glycerol-3-phosphate acyltransferase [Actinoplanes philippinensis]